MTAIIISDVTIRDPDAAGVYRQRAADSIARHGGKYLASGGEVECVEGSWHPQTVIVVEFPNMEAARHWYRSKDYALALEVRDAALVRHLIFVDGVPAASDG
jgi:uncharacterized protein (DUF1330 family)